ncbi:hypothetical protein ACPCG0_10400 [Propionibacteriaceae bacterium Y1923]|uniref:hypothetical protein n=1 Tax=Aestuariimicrobium sp. Y1814 TaxID=3418742 RepID=UPI003C1ADE3E
MRSLDSPFGILGLIMIFAGVLLVVVSVAATVNIHERGLTVRSSFFQTTEVPWPEVDELLPATSSFSSFRIAKNDGSTVLVDRLSMKPVFNKQFEAKPHKDVELVLKNFENWKTAGRP